MKQTEEYESRPEPVREDYSYDFDNPQFFNVDEEEDEYVDALPKKRSKHSRKADRDPRQSLSLGAILAYVCAAALAVCALMAQIKLTSVAAEAANAQEQLSELHEENNTLLVKYESTFNLWEIEQYATEVLGMSKLSSEQTFLIDAAASDRAVVLKEPTGTNKLLDKLEDLLFGSEGR